MKRITITLSEDLHLLVEAEAQRRTTSLSEVIRDAVREALHGYGKRRIPFAGICEDPKMTMGREVERKLGKDWADDLARNRR